MIKRLTILLLLCILLPSLLLAAEQAAAPGMVIRADSMSHDLASDTIKADGKVEMTWQDMTMTADHATFNRTTHTLTATGNVHLLKAGDTLSGDQLVMDTETGRAEMENGRIFMTQGNFRADGKQIARLGESDYALRSGGLTTCDAATPSWKFGASELDVTLEEFATGKNVVFYVKDIPVFYFPYLILPVKRERQSGLLFPRFGNSSKRGLFVDIPFYWAISESQEATIDLDVQTKRGVGIGVDYRYLRSRTSEGSVGGYLIYDNNQNKERGQLVQFHKEQFSDSFNLITSLNLTSDRTFLQDYADQSGEYNRQYYDSRVVLTKFWNQWLTSGQAIYTQDFYSSSNTTTLQRAPELSLYGVREQLPGIPRLYLDLDLLLTNYYREKGLDGKRMVLAPRLTTTQELFNGRLNLSLFGGVQLRGYDTDSATTTGIKEDQLVAVPEAGAQLTSAFSRLYDIKLLDLERVRHELVPTLSFLYVGDKDQSSVPVFDHLDRMNAQQTITLSLANHIGGRIAKQGGTAEYRNLLTLRLLQSYTPSGTRSNLLTLTGDSRPWSDLTLESDTWLHRHFRLLADLRYSHYSHRIASTASGFAYNDQRGNTGRISYRMVDQQLDYLEAGATIALTNPVHLAYSTRYSFDKRDFLESNYTLEYRHQCWSMIVGYQERPNNRTWTVNFNLAGLFGIGTGPSTGYRAPTP
jgi:LPS-assembly protein